MASTSSSTKRDDDRPEAGTAGKLTSDFDPRNSDLVVARASRRKLTPVGEVLKTLLDPILLPIVDSHWGVASVLLTSLLAFGIFVAALLLDSVLPAGAEGSLLQAPYDLLRPYAGNHLFPFMVGGGVYFLACVTYTALDFLRPAWVQRFMIQPRPAADFGGTELGLLRTVRQQGRCFAWVVPFSTGLALTGAQVLYRRPWLEPCFSACPEFQLPTIAPSALEFVVHIAFSLLMNDLAYWYWHWMCHRHRALYKHIHQIHHEYKAPFALEGAHVHPLEFLAVYAFAFVPPMSLGSHPFTFWVWLSMATLMGVEDHSGYRFSPFSLLLTVATLGDWGGAPHHDFHHQSPWCNYQPFLGYLDRLCGTGAPKVPQAPEAAVEAEVVRGRERDASGEAAGLRKREATPPRSAK